MKRLEFCKYTAIYVKVYPIKCLGILVIIKQHHEKIQPTIINYRKQGSVNNFDVDYYGSNQRPSNKTLKRNLSGNLHYWITEKIKSYEKYGEII